MTRRSRAFDRLTGMWSRKSKDDDGSVLVLVIFSSLLATAVVLAVIAASSLYIERKRLLSLADGAALAGAESFSLDSVKISDGRASVHLVPREVNAVVRNFVSRSMTPESGRVRVDTATTLDGTSATVTLSRMWHPPVVSFLMPEGIRIDVTSVARSVFWHE